jgi:hypothetical protein
MRSLCWWLGVVVLTVLFGAAVLITAPNPAAASDTEDTWGFVDPASGVWRFYHGYARIAQFYYGNPGDHPFMGDWNCDDIDTPGLYRRSDGYVYLRNSNTRGVADVSFFFGNPGDMPIAGDFNADGCDTLSIYRPSEQRFYIINELGTNDGGLGGADFSFLFGNAGDKPFVGDFNGNGQDTVGLHRESTGLVYFRNTLTTGNADNQFVFGDPGDRFFAGDWTGDGIDSPGLFRPSTTYIYLRHTNTQGNADEEWWAGLRTWLPVAGRLFDCANQSSIPTAECEALVALFNSTGGNYWRSRSGWLADPDPCTWSGVSCSDGSVAWLSLRGNQLSGSLPKELGDLTNIWGLELPSNNLRGPIPTELGELTTLDTLMLQNNTLTGLIPESLGDLEWLTGLSLSYNRLSGPVPPTLMNLRNLDWLYLRGQTGCLTAATPAFGTWLAGFDSDWNNGCPE